jgi:hypothetical protein
MVQVNIRLYNILDYQKGMSNKILQFQSRQHLLPKAVTMYAEKLAHGFCGIQTLIASLTQNCVP